MGISLWLVPNKTIAAKIETVMEIRPASPIKSTSSFPSFYPHLTLASSTDRDALRAAIPTDQRVVPVRFDSLEVGDKYFMSVFVAVHSPPGSPLETLRSHLRAALGDRAVPPLPHMSLYYIDEADVEQREATAQRLRVELRALASKRDGERAVDLTYLSDSGVDGEQDVELIGGFEGEEVWMVKCEGPVPEWEVLGKYPLLR